MRRMRWLAAFMIMFGIWASSWGVWATFNRKHPISLLGGVMAPLGVALVVLGGVLMFVPGFFG